MGWETRVRLVHVAISIFAFLSSVEAFYIPGYSIKSYRNDEPLPLFVNKIFSDNSQFQYAYFDLPFVCPPSGKKLGKTPFGSGQSMALNLGEVLRGDRIMVSDFEIEMGKDAECKSLCNLEVKRKDIQRAREYISDAFVTEWILDNLPGATSMLTVDKARKYYATGFKIGYQAISSTTGQLRHYINNHFTFVIRWRDAPGKAGRAGGKVIVGFEVYAKSIAAGEKEANGCPVDVHGKHPGFELFIAPNNTRLAEQYPGSSYLPEHEESADDDATLSIPYSYSVYFRKEDKVEWSNRWDLYFFSQQDGKVTHWLAVLNSIAISGILGITVLVIWSRTVNNDAKESLEIGNVRLKPRKSSTGKTPNPDEKPANGSAGKGDADADASSSDEEFDDSVNWKRLHADVFRTPEYSGLLAPLVGSGMQLLFMAAGLLLLSCFGILNPSFRGGFVSVGMGLFIFAGVFSGYFSGRLYSTFGGQNWRKNTMITALLFPGLLFAQIFFLNLFVWARASSTALPFSTLVGLVALWLLIQVPLVYLGSWIGYSKIKPWEHPTRTNAIARQIPPQPWYLRPVRGTLLAGLIPFAVLFVELFFVFRNLLQDKSGYYYLFGYLGVICSIMLVTVSEVTIIATYGQLCLENHRWWWRSFLTGGSSAFWIFLYSVWYFFTKLNIRGLIPSMLFFSYSFLGCMVYGLLTGTVGFLTAYSFVRRIYNSVKAD